MNTIVLIIFGIVIAPVFSGTPVFDGRCPTADIDVLKNFDQAKFQGFWYVIERYEVYQYNSCSRYNYIWDEGERGFNEILMQKGRDPESPSSVTTEWKQSIIEEKVNNSNDGTYTFQYSFLKTQNYHFVDTDYVNYAVLWTCLPAIRTDTHEQNLVVMARDKFFDINSLESLNATLAKSPFDRSLLRPINHTDIICQHDVV